MNEKDLSVLEQYDLSVKEVYRGRGSYVCITDQGRKLLMEYRGSEKKARCEQALLRNLQANGYTRLDIPVTNAAGNVVSKDRDGRGFLLKDWMEGRECDVCRGDELKAAASNLGVLHQKLVLPQERMRELLLLEEGDAASMDSVAVEKAPVVEAASRKESERTLSASPVFGFAATAARRNRELKKVRAFIRSKKNKSDFELYFLQYFPMFYEKGVWAKEQLEQPEFAQLEAQAQGEGRYRHGDYSHHNVWFTATGVTAVHFEHFSCGCQQEDLVLFLRKIMEKYDWEERIGRTILDAYTRVHPLSGLQRRYLALRLTYPEKFWKIANRYYNVNKAWFLGQNTSRLVKLAVQETKKEYFIRKIV